MIVGVTADEVELVGLVSEKPTYTQIAEWRRVLARLVQFLRLVDMQVMELLRRLVKTSLRHLLEFMNSSSCVIGEEVVIPAANNS